MSSVIQSERGWYGGVQSPQECKEGNCPSQGGLPGRNSLAVTERMMSS